MPSQLEQINTFISKEFLLCASVLFLIARQVVTGSDDCCPKETLYWGPESIPIIWPETSASNKQIGSDCMYDLKQLLPRICNSQYGWMPALDDIETRCLYYQPSYAGFGNCPPGYTESKKNDFCYQQISSDSWEELCLTTGGSSSSFLDLKSDEQYSILQELLASKSHAEAKLNIGLPAKNKRPSKQISGEIDYNAEAVELQWMLPGRYGSILKYRNNSAAVVCKGYQNLCVDMCLSINISESTAHKPFIPTVEECSNVNSVLCVSKKKSVVRNVGCSMSGYYRVGYATQNTLCYSIKIFNQPLSIDDDSGMVLPLSCEGNKIFQIDTLESYIIYRHLASATKLGKHERCLFGITSLNAIIKYSEWGQLDHEDIEFTNWDKSVDFSTVYSRPDSYLTVNLDGKWRWEESATCIVCAMDDPPSSSELNLRFSTTSSMLTLIVTGQEYLWKNKNSDLGFLCFALISNNYMAVPVIFTGQSGHYFVINVGAGKYWCSGHIIQTIQLVESKIVYAFGMVFAFYVEHHCEEDCAPPFDHTEKLLIFLSSLINEDLMKLEDVQYIDHDPNYTEEKVKILFHVTISVKEEILHDNEHNEVGLSEYQLYTYYALKELRKLHTDDIDEPFEILSVMSREFCLPDSIISSDVLNWKAAKVGETVEILVDCFNFKRTCSSNALTGSEWGDHTFQFVCNNHSEISLGLIDLHNSFRSSKQIPEVVSNLSTTLHNVTLNEADVFIVSEIFEKLSNFLTIDQPFLSYCDVKNVVEVFNSLMLITEDVARASIQLNSTNSLLASFDEILIHQAHMEPTHYESRSDGVLSIKSSLITNYILDPMVSGFSGIALAENNVTEKSGFLNYSVRFLQPNESIDALLNDEKLIIASFVPQELIETWNNPKIIFTLFFNDILFQSQKNKINSDGSIISLTILNSHSELSSSIPFLFKPNNSLFHESSYRSAQLCGYWNFLSENGWESTGCVLNEQSLRISDKILCECSHLTHFGNLINTEILYSEINEKILNLITLAGCALSLLGTIGIFLTAIVFRSWRNKSSSKFLLQLSAAISLQMILLILINSDDDLLLSISGNVYGCIATGALIHYSILVMFFWMLIIAYLQFIRYVIVFNQMATANFLLKSSIFGWGMPMLPVFILVSVDPTSYIPSANVKFCYPSGYGFLFGLLVPIILIVFANAFVFIAVIISLIKGSSKSAACKVNDKNDAIWSQLRLSVFLFFVLGLSWIFGFLSDRSILFSYLFCLTATLQGFVLFLYFVILDPVARNLWQQLFMKVCGYKSQ